MTDGQWMTYADAGTRLGINAEAVRRRADRGKWARMPGNDGRTRVQVPDDARATQAPPVRADTGALVSPLEAHITTLKTLPANGRHDMRLVRRRTRRRLS